MPTSAAARPPNACESAIRSGILVIGIQIDIAAPISEPMMRPSDDPLVADDLVVKQRVPSTAAACRGRRAACRGARAWASTAAAASG